MATLYLGISGYDYKEWQGEGLFYPPTVKKSAYFSYYTSRYNSVEFLGAMRTPPADSSIARWLGEAPEGFRVSPKMQDYVTHIARLRPETLPVLKAFVDKMEPVAAAGKLGTVLLQLPPGLKRNDDLLQSFLEGLPAYPWARWAMEFRNDSWNAPEVEEILRSKNIAWVASDTDETPAQRRDTADHLYTRLRRLAYTDEALQEWASYFRSKLNEGKDCYVYCRHKDVPEPWKWADRLRELIPAG